MKCKNPKPDKQPPYRSNKDPRKRLLIAYSPLHFLLLPFYFLHVFPLAHADLFVISTEVPQVLVIV